MASYSGQPEVSADAGRDEVVNDPDDAQATQYYYRAGHAIPAHQRHENNTKDRYDRDPHAPVQMYSPPSSIEGFCSNLALCIFMMASAYWLYSLMIGHLPSVGIFLLYIVIPKESAVLIYASMILMYFWYGQFIFVCGIFDLWPIRIIDELTAVFFFLPLGLLWCLWPFSFLFKASWTAIYLWLYLLFGRSFAGGAVR